jgi:hypothetical protein
MFKPAIYHCDNCGHEEDVDSPGLHKWVFTESPGRSFRDGFNHYCSAKCMIEVWTVHLSKDQMHAVWKRRKNGPVFESSGFTT